MSTEGYPRFSDGEMQRRIQAARDLAARLDLDALLIFGHSGSRRHYQADVHWLTEVAPYHECYLLVPVRGEPVLWTTHNNHLASARELSRIPDVRRTFRDSARYILEELKLRALAGARFGLVGSFFYQELDTLRAELPQATWQDVTPKYKHLRMHKSEEELAWQRLAAAGCDRVMAAIQDAIRPGVEERDLLVLSEELAWQEGCAPNFLYLNSSSMADSDSCVPNQHLSRRKLRMGDVINTELTVSYGMYSAQLLRPFYLGEPTPAYQAIYKLLKQVHDELLQALRPGTTLMELYDISCTFREAGYSTVDGVLHGFGVDIMPPTVGSGFAVPAKYTLEAGVTVVLQPNLTTVDERSGMQLGQMGLITPEGFQSMHASPPEVVQCA